MWLVTKNTARYSTVHDVVIVRQVANNLAVAISFLKLHIFFQDHKKWMKSIIFS